MNITTFNKVLLPVLQAKITPWLWSVHAKGKSECVETFYKSRNWLIFNFRLNCMADVGDFLGLQDFEIDDKGQKVASKFCMPDWLKQCIDFCKANPDKRACVFIDEINRAARFDLLGPVFQVALDRRLHTYEFPDNLDVICASNPPTNNYKVLAVSDEALLSRFWHVYFSPTKQEWLDYTRTNNYDSSIAGFLEEYPQFLEQDTLTAFSIGDYAKPDRRKWHMINKLMQSKLLNKDEQSDVFAGLIGIAGAIAYEGYLKKMDKPITVEEILQSYSKVRDRVVSAANSEKARTDIIGTAADKIVEHFKDDPVISETEGTNVISFIKDLPNDYMFRVMYAIYRKRKFHDFCETNYDKLAMTELEERLVVIRRTVEPETLLKNA